MFAWGEKICYSSTSEDEDDVVFHLRLRYHLSVSLQQSTPFLFFLFGCRENFPQIFPSPHWDCEKPQHYSATKITASAFRIAISFLFVSFFPFVCFYCADRLRVNWIAVSNSLRCFFGSWFVMWIHERLCLRILVTALHA